MQNDEMEVLKKAEVTAEEAKPAILQNETATETTSIDDERFKRIFKILYEIDVRSHLEEKNGLSYLSWSWAWAELCKVYPTAKYEFIKFKDSNGNIVPFQDLGDLGCLVHTRITIDGLVREMSLPIMDPSNKAMKTQPYNYMAYDWKEKKQVEKHCNAYDIMDVNRALWRCLVKNMAMFGLGLKVYSGDDLPPEVDPTTGEVLVSYRPLKRSSNEKKQNKTSTATTPKLASPKQIEIIKSHYNTPEYLAEFCRRKGIKTIEELPSEEASKQISSILAARKAKTADTGEKK